MIQNINFKTIGTFLILSICFIAPTNAQFWKKLKQKAQEKISKAEDKLIDNLDKKTDKKIDETIDGKKEEDKTVDKSFGTASISHSILYGKTNISSLTTSKVNKQGKNIEIIGYWDTFGVDVHDGYILRLKNVDDINTLQNKTFKIPEEASLRLDYDALVKGSYNFDAKIRAPQQELEFTSGTVTVTFNKDENVMISFSGSGKINNHNIEKKEGDYSMKGNTPATLNGTISTASPEYTITKEFKQKEKKESNTDLTESDKTYLKEKLSPTVNIPSSFSFDKNIELEFTNDTGDSYPMEFLLGKYPDIWGMSVASKEMQGQGKVIMVMTPTSSTAFMDVAGMKMKKTTSLEQMGDQYNMTDKLPEDGDFEYKKTGNTKTILGYTCEEYRVDYDYTNSKGSSVFWVSKEFPIQNKELPMLGMKMNNPYFNGFVLELNTNHNGQNYSIKVIKMVDKDISINTSEYKKMGF